MMRPLVTLTTDFGMGSPYLAQMKGVLLSLARERSVDVEIIDITHAIGPQNVRQGAVVLADIAPRFPAGTIHVAVVDPGVGTRRRLIYAEIGTQKFLAPDNGLVSLLTRTNSLGSAFVLSDPQYWLPEPSRTFHGRDILAPVAAHLVSGLDPSRLGPPANDLVELELPQSIREGAAIHGEVLYVDSFGNLITNITHGDLTWCGDRAQLMVECAGRQIRGVLGTYGESPPGSLLALIDSQGRLEIAIACGSAARELGAAEREPVVVRGG
jgi:S-adenosylmethionine hydrolase